MTADAERLTAIQDIIRRAEGHVNEYGLRLDSDELRRVLGEAFDCGAATLAAEYDALRARIAAIEATARDTIAQWERTDDDDLTDVQYGERGYALGVLAALGAEQPLTAREDPRRRIVSEAERMSIEAMKFRDGVPSAFNWPKP